MDLTERSLTKYQYYELLEEKSYYPYLYPLPQEERIYQIPPNTFYI